MGLRDRLHAVVVAERERVVSEIEKQAPHRGLRRSIVAPRPEDLPDVLERIRAYWRIGQPDIHLGERKPSPFFSKVSKERR